VCDDQTDSTQNCNVIEISLEHSEMSCLSVARALEICATYTDWETGRDQEGDCHCMTSCWRLLLKMNVESLSTILRWNIVFWMAQQHITLKEKFTYHKILAESYVNCFWQCGCSAPQGVPVGQVVNRVFCITVLKHMRNVIHWKRLK